jgi:hypothetical protein
LLYLYMNPRIDPRLTKVPWVMPRWYPSSKTEMIWKNIWSVVCFMTFCSISTTTAATAELVYIQWLNTSPQFYPNRKTKDFFIFWFFSWFAKFPPSLLH